jgi:hypothetical protein
MLPTRRADLVSREVEGEVVILDRATGHVHRLNPTASFIWNQCDGASTPAEIAARLATSFDRTPEHVLGDVTTTLADLTRLGLLIQQEPK